MQARTLIVDDEPLARMRMRSLLEKYSEDLEIIDEAGSGAQAISKINELTPDVVFLDPMFPERRRRAATNKKLQLFQRLERPCEDEEALCYTLEYLYKEATK